MFTKVLNRMREKVRSRQYVMTYHARQEMKDDHFSLFDVERGILTGEILERQKDSETNEWKYRIQGLAFSGNEIELVAKISATNKLVIITVYAP